jgi:hypothetical protein
MSILFTAILILGAVIDDKVAIAPTQANISQAADASIQVYEAGFWGWIKRAWNCARCVYGAITGDDSDAHKNRCKYCRTGKAS